MTQSPRSGPPTVGAFDGEFAAVIRALFPVIQRDPQLQRLPPEFFARADAYFTAHPARPGDAQANDAYFNEFSPLWRAYAERGLYHRVLRVLDLMLAPARAWEETHPGQRIHKGTPFYWLATFSILNGDLHSGYLFAHRAVLEDELTTEKRNPDLPALRLAEIDDEKRDQAFYPWVSFKAGYLRDHLRAYRDRTSSALDLPRLRSRFLTKAGLREPVFLLSYTVGRLAHLSTAPDYATDSAFASQLSAQLLFNLAQVIEEAIRHRSGRKSGRDTFIAQAEHLLTKAGSSITRQDLGDLNGRYQRRFEKTLALLLDQRCRIRRRKPSHQERALLIAYGVRNRAGHRLGSSPILQKRHRDAEQALLHALFFVVDVLYRRPSRR